MQNFFAEYIYILVPYAINVKKDYVKKKKHMHCFFLFYFFIDMTLDTVPQKCNNFITLNNKKVFNFINI